MLQLLRKLIFVNTKYRNISWKLYFSLNINKIELPNYAKVGIKPA